MNDLLDRDRMPLPRRTLFHWNVVTTALSVTLARCRFNARLQWFLHFSNWGGRLLCIVPVRLFITLVALLRRSAIFVHAPSKLVLYDFAIAEREILCVAVWIWTHLTTIATAARSWSVSQWMCFTSISPIYRFKVGVYHLKFNLNLNLFCIIFLPRSCIICYI